MVPILPLVFTMYIVNYLDRANVSFAKLPMSEELGFSERVYGQGAGIFFIGYLAFEIPGALIVERFGARRWMARILITWGLCTAAVGMVLTEHIYEILKTTKSAQDPNVSYFAALERLTAEDWRRSQ